SMSKATEETHTVTFGPTKYLNGLAKGFEGTTFPPAGAYPSDPTQPIVLTPKSHGNGFANLGVLDRDPTTPTIPPSGRIKFTKPGVYHFICLIHTQMQGTIVVSP
ncbi:MAG TPA: hypothetical protein VMU39_13020, partial [Solirubrobacteraceae bacterium]|nr:hypothetical protein [Solirubrobacteraceae bacterium]